LSTSSSNRSIQNDPRSTATAFRGALPRRACTKIHVAIDELVAIVITRMKKPVGRKGPLQPEQCDDHEGE